MAFVVPAHRRLIMPFSLKVEWLRGFDALMSQYRAFLAGAHVRNRRSVASVANTSLPLSMPSIHSRRSFSGAELG